MIESKLFFFRENVNMLPKTLSDVNIGVKNNDTTHKESTVKKLMPYIRELIVNKVSNIRLSTKHIAKDLARKIISKLTPEAWSWAIVPSVTSSSKYWLVSRTRPNNKLDIIVGKYSPLISETSVEIVNGIMSMLINIKAKAIIQLLLLKRLFLISNLVITRSLFIFKIF